MYKLEIGVLANNHAESVFIIKHIYKNCIDNNKDRSVDYNWCVCDNIRYTIVDTSVKHKSKHFDQIILCKDYTPNFDYIYNSIDNMLKNSCVPFQYMVLRMSDSLILA